VLDHAAAVTTIEGFRQMDRYLPSYAETGRFVRSSTAGNGNVDQFHQYKYMLYFNISCIYGIFGEPPVRSPRSQRRRRSRATRFGAGPPNTSLGL